LSHATMLPRAQVNDSSNDDKASSGQRLIL